VKEIELNQSLLNVWLNDFREHFITVMEDLVIVLKSSEKGKNRILNLIRSLGMISQSMVCMRVGWEWVRARRKC
jgi:hypothetical protein